VSTSLKVFGSTEGRGRAIVFGVGAAPHQEPWIAGGGAVSSADIRP